MEFEQKPGKIIRLTWSWARPTTWKNRPSSLSLHGTRKLEKAQQFTSLEFWFWRVMKRKKLVPKSGHMHKLYAKWLNFAWLASIEILGQSIYTSSPTYPSRSHSNVKRVSPCEGAVSTSSPTKPPSEVKLCGHPSRGGGGGGLCLRRARKKSQKGGIFHCFPPYNKRFPSTTKKIKKK